MVWVGIFIWSHNIAHLYFLNCPSSCSVPHQLKCCGEKICLRRSKLYWQLKLLKQKWKWHMKVKVGVESESEKAGLYYSIKMLRRKNLPAALRAPLGRVFKVLGFSAWPKLVAVKHAFLKLPWWGWSSSQLLLSWWLPWFQSLRWLWGLHRYSLRWSRVKYYSNGILGFLPVHWNDFYSFNIPPQQAFWFLIFSPFTFVLLPLLALFVCVLMFDQVVMIFGGLRIW